MDNSKKHDYTDTIEEAKDINIEKRPEDKRKDAEIAYEALAASTSMGLFGMEEHVSELIQTELVAQLADRFILDEEKPDRE